MDSFIDVIAADDYDERRNSRKAVAVAYKRVHTRFANFLLSADDKNDFENRVELISDDLADTVADTIEEYGGDSEKVLSSVRDQLVSKGGFCDDCHNWKSGPRANCTCGGDTTKTETDGDSDNGQDLIDDSPSGVDKEGAAKEAGPGLMETMPEMLQQQQQQADQHALQKSLQSPSVQNMYQNPMTPAAQGPGAGNPLNPQAPANQPTPANQVGWGAQQGAGQALDQFKQQAEGLANGSPHPQQPQQVPYGSKPGQPMLPNGSNPMSVMGSEKMADTDVTGLSDAPSPKMDKRRWKPNALNEKGNLKPIDTDKGSRWPSEKQDIHEPVDHQHDFLEQTKADHTTQEDLPSDPGYDGAGFNTDKDQEQYPTKTFGDEHGTTDPVTRTPLV